MLLNIPCVPALNLTASDELAEPSPIIDTLFKVGLENIPVALLKSVL